jgi:hypothetical protein
LFIGLNTGFVCFGNVRALSSFPIRHGNPQGIRQQPFDRRITLGIELLQKGFLYSWSAIANRKRTNNPFSHSRVVQSG